MDKRLGKITSVRMGYCGYQDAMVGFELGFGGDGWGIGGWSKCTWAGEPSDHAEWTLEDQTKHWGEAVREMARLVKEAKVKNFADLKGIPVEVTLNGQAFHSFRILTEVV